MTDFSTKNNFITSSTQVASRKLNFPKLCSLKSDDFRKKGILNFQRKSTCKQQRLKLTGINSDAVQPSKTYNKIRRMKTSRTFKEISKSIYTNINLKKSPGFFFEYNDELQLSEKGTLYTKYTKQLHFVNILKNLSFVLNVLFFVIDNYIFLNKTFDVFQNNDLLTGISEAKKRKLCTAENVLLTFSLIFSIFSAVCIFITYQIELKIDKYEFKAAPNDTLITTGAWKIILLKVICCLITLPPGINTLIFIGNAKSNLKVYSLNGLFCLLTMIKPFIVFFKTRSSLHNSIIEQVAFNHFKMTPTFLFFLKAIQKSQPFIIITAFFFYLMVMISILLRNVEILVFDKGVLYSNSHNLSNSFWLTFSVVSTLSLGDYYPVTMLGNIISTVGGLFGYYILTLFFLTLCNYSEFSFEEKKSFTKITKIISGENKENKAANVIRSTIFLKKYIQAYKKSKSHQQLAMSDQKYSDGNVEYVKNMFGVICYLRVYVKAFCNEYKFSNSTGVPVDEMLQYLQNKYYQSISCEINLFKKMGTINGNLEKIVEGNKEIDHAYREIGKMQKVIEDYLIKINNENLLKHYWESERVKVFKGNGEEKETQ